jgi:hypothetical protein
VIVSLAVYPRWVDLYFVRLEHVGLLDEPRVVSLLRAAVRHGKTPLATTGRGYLVIKSVSGRQRPRRPAQEVKGS